VRVVDGDDALFAAMDDADHQRFGPVEIDLVRVGEARIKRSVYPAGLRWSVDLQPLIGTERCQHAHGGFLASGNLSFEYPDGCEVEYVAPAVVDIAPGHDAWVPGDEPAVLIEVDFEGNTVSRLGIAAQHQH
jgi:hypothetical protein